MTDLGGGFGAVADLYDDARPRYPDDLYDAVAEVCPLLGAEVLDLAAGTGIASRGLMSRGARVVALDAGEAMLRRLRTRSPGISCVVARAEQIPFVSNKFDLVTCVTAWHWVDTSRTLAEARRVLRPGGHLALWWANNRWGDGIDWEEARSEVYVQWEAKYGAWPAASGEAGTGARDAAADLRARGLQVVVETAFGWTRDCSCEDHVRTIATHSGVIALGERKQEFLDELAAALQPWPVLTERLEGPLIIARFPPPPPPPSSGPAHNR